jgi:betaine-aldehyde dehydrogenase
LLCELDLPAGVFNFVTGGAAVGGASIMKAATGNFKRIALELGGKNPNIVFSDADVDVAADYALNAAFFHAGQVCSAGSRLMVQDGIYDDFVSRLTQRMSRIVVGSGLESGTQMGPVQSAQQRDKVLGMDERGIAEGARLVCGGKRPQGDAYEKGFWLEPTLLADVNANMSIAKEEVFGPVLTAERFTTEDEALRRANGTPYGLAAAVWTRDLDRANRMSQALRFGTVWVNDYHPYFPEAPWGGYKASGIGRELARVGLDEYTELKHSYINLAPKAMGWFGA